MNIRKLGIDDANLYFSHLNRVYDQKGLMSVKDADWVNEQREANVTLEKVHKLLENPMVSIWGQFIDDKIVKSIRTELAPYTPVAKLINFKSESTRPFTPTTLLPFLDIVLSYYERNGIYTFFLIRRLDWFESRRLVNWEDNVPLNRYNSYYEEIIEPGEISKYPSYRVMAGNITYPVRTAVVQMSLKQEYRIYGEERYPPVTAEMAKIKSDSERHVCIIGSSPGKIGESISASFRKTGSKVTTITRRDIDFSSPWENNLLQLIPAVTGELIIVLNIYDYTPGKGRLQEEIFNLLWKNFSDKKSVQIVVMGSMAHYYNLENISEEYKNSKRSLRNNVVSLGRSTEYNCKLLFVEPGVVDNYLDSKPSWPARYITKEELSNKIVAFVDSNSKFLFTMVDGPDIYKPDK